MSIGYSSKVLKTIGMFGLLGAFGHGCAGSDKKLEGQVVGPAEPINYTLRLGKTVVSKDPLPDFTPIIVDWHYASGAVKSRLGFNGWDFNQDGRLDMVEVLRDDDKIESVVFDFDFDGEIDLIRHNK